MTTIAELLALPESKNLEFKRELPLAAGLARVMEERSRDERATCSSPR